MVTGILGGYGSSKIYCIRCVITWRYSNFFMVSIVGLKNYQLTHHGQRLHPSWPKKRPFCTGKFNTSRLIMDGIKTWYKSQAFLRSPWSPQKKNKNLQDSTPSIVVVSTLCPKVGGCLSQVLRKPHSFVPGPDFSGGFLKVINWPFGTLFSRP